MACFCHVNGIEVKDAKARPVANLLELKLKKNLEVGNVITTMGYHRANDGGMSRYLIRPIDELDIDDGGSTIIINDNLTAEMLLSDNESVNARQYGAKGDGVTDDSVALQNLLTNNSNVVIANGTYVVSQSLKLKNNQIITLINATIISTKKYSDEPILWALGVKDVHINGINSTVRYASTGENQTIMKIEFGNNIHIKGLTFDAFTSAIEILDSEETPSDLIMIKDCIFIHTDSNLYDAEVFTISEHAKNVFTDDNFLVIGTAHNFDKLPNVGYEDDDQVDLGEPDEEPDGEDPEELPGTDDPDHNGDREPTGDDDQVDLGNP